MKSKKVTRKDVLFLSISFFVMVVAWVGFNLYHTWVTSTISADLQMQIQPIDPTFDMATINQLKKREKIVPLFELTGLQASAAADLIPTPPISLSPSPLEVTTTPTPSTAPDLSEEIIIIPTEEPTPGL